jgi:MFS family permease
MPENQTDTLRAPAEPVSFPPGLHNAYLFSTFNAFSYQVVLNSPMVLYAKTLGASATVLGIIAGMMPLLVIFQIPAASYIPRLGFRRFVYAGWGTRVMFIFAMALVPLSGGFLEAKTLLALMLMLLFGFNLSRGISSCAWLPWITALVPARLRGKYLARDAAVQNLASFVTFLIAAACLAGPSRPWQFAILFAFSATMGAISLGFLKRIPDVAMPEEVRTSRGPVPWLAMVVHPPFRKLLVTLVGYSVAYGGMTAFTVAFLKTEAGLSECKILLVTSVAFLGGLCSLWLLGSRLDRLGSKPVLAC